MNKFFLAIILLCLIKINAQVTEDYQPTIHSPQINAFAKFIDFPVDLYTGQAQVSVPIHELKVGDISVPISLQHHTSGVKVEDIASWVGVNWSLNAGGQITRAINGMPDYNKEWFYKEPPFELTYSYSLALTEDYTSILESATGIKDSEHDIYYYTAGEYSGKFIIDFENEGEIVTIPKEDVIILKKTITTPDGLIYMYSPQELNTQTTYCSTSGTNAANYQYGTATAWFLKRIESNTTNAYVDFYYENKHLEYELNGLMTINENLISDAVGPVPNDDECEIANKIDTQRLTHIVTSDGQTISFNIGNERLDLFGDYLLDNITITRDNSPSRIKYNLDYNYLKDRSFRELNDPIFDGVTEQAEDIRPFLMSIEKTGEDDSRIPYFKFDYYLNMGLPSRRSFAQDHFGYYNGVQNSTLVPSAYINGIYYSGANRNPDVSFAKEGSLTSVESATGGIRKYTYGLNTCINCDSESFSSPPQPSFRIESTSDFNVYSYSDRATYEKEFSMKGNGEINLSATTESSFYKEAELRLFKLNDDGSINHEIIDADSFRESDDINSISETIDYYFDGDYLIQLVVNNPSWYANQDEFVLNAKLPEPYEKPTGSIETSGLRVEEIEIYDPQTNDVITKEFEYGKGYITAVPVYERNAQNLYTGESSFVSSDYIKRSSSPTVSLSKTKSGVIGYYKVTVKEKDNGYVENIYYTSSEHQDRIINDPVIQGSELLTPYVLEPRLVTVTGFGDFGDYADNEWNYPYPLRDEKDWKRGLIKERNTYDINNNIVKKTENEYRFYDDMYDPYYDPSKIRNIYGIKGGSEAANLNGDGVFRFKFYRLQSTWYDIDNVTETNYFNNGTSTSTTVEYEYSDFQRTVKTQKITNSKGDKLKTTTLYPTDTDIDAHIDADIDTDMLDLLMSKNLLNSPIAIIQEVENEIISEVISTYEEEHENVNLTGIETRLKGNTDGIEIAVSYDNYGNTIEVSKEDGTSTYYIWGYNGQYPLAKLENFEKSEITPNVQSLIDDSISESEDDDDTCTDAGTCDEKNLRIALNNLRDYSALSNAMVTTYTYDPLIGVTSITDPKGYTMYYEYDEFNRLEFVKDAQGNLVSENKYNYKN